jgi:hypothetical protein
MRKGIYAASWVITDELTPIEEVLREFIATFHGPLPAHVIDAMSVIFNLDDDNFDLLDDALL